MIESNEGAGDGTEAVGGRELDAKVAERVMGWTVNRPGDRHWHTVGGGLGGRQVGGDCCTQHYGRAFCPSTDIAAAWEVVEKMAEFSCDFDLERASTEWFANFMVGSASGPTAPLAICRAALLATATDTGES